MEITFGKYKGSELEDIPKEYLQWVIDNVEQTMFNAHLFQEIEEILFSQKKLPILENDEELARLQNAYDEETNKLHNELSVMNSEIINESWMPTLSTEFFIERFKRWHSIKDKIHQCKEIFKNDLKEYLQRTEGYTPDEDLDEKIDNYLLNNE